MSKKQSTDETPEDAVVPPVEEVKPDSPAQPQEGRNGYVDRRYPPQKNSGNGK